ncbi:poor homologous synapsis 1 isoform X2 [Tasmannia lanceolata]|uniref:poor homologous synapsis 1 isoform X2 n=1 Tax=Tasmannia lanceolata TaxID=3420 RepID=UPI00406301B2
MAGVLTFLQSSDNLNSSVIPIQHTWQVEFSRFFNFPRIFSSSLTLKPLPKSKTLCKGNWISSSSLASLCLLSNPAILVVSMGGKIYVSCVTQCPIRGSRVVFSSYRDSYGQIQKFALRFPTTFDAQTFLNAVKENLKDVLDVGYLRNDFGRENSFQSEYVASSGLEYRGGKDSRLEIPSGMYMPTMLLTDFRDEQHECSQQLESSLEIPNECYIPEMPLIDVNNEQHVCSQQPFSHDFEGIFSALPPSFTALLTGCSTENNEASAPISVTSSMNTAQLPMVPEEFDLKSQVMRYMSDSTFHDMLAKVEKVIDELGGDLLSPFAGL